MSYDEIGFFLILLAELEAFLWVQGFLFAAVLLGSFIRGKQGMLERFSTNAPIDQDFFAGHTFGVGLCRIGGFVSEPFVCMVIPTLGLLF